MLVPGLPGDIEQCPVTLLVTEGRRCLLASSQRKPEMLINTLQCAGQLLTTKNSPAPRLGGAAAERAWLEEIWGDTGQYMPQLGLRVAQVLRSKNSSNF